MEHPITEQVNLQLYDYFDNVKVALSELNQSKALVINGPTEKLLKRGFDISYYQGQKKAIDAINTLLQTYSTDEKFIQIFTDYAIETDESYSRALEQFSKLLDIPDDFDTQLATFYKLKGQKFIIDNINALIREN